MPRPYRTPKCTAPPRTPEELTSDYLNWLQDHPDVTGYIFNVKGSSKAAKCTKLMIADIGYISTPLLAIDPMEND